ncbi:hypothetical protein ASPCAL07728 [Aspergillus calidoustus]|uniref:Uncharacterized protein n=1 Tax=Aspergillus calidoustus TaxID=454130 RepID=A0A0U5GN91_ASPCI|nr:hypothetical protein ASPCAL07728 [Aspergillus calidoustus]
MFNQTLTLSIAQIALPGSAEGWTILVDDPKGTCNKMFNVARANEPGYINVTKIETETGTVPDNTNGLMWKLKVCYIWRLDIEKVKAAASAARPGKTPHECLLEVFRELENKGVVFEGAVKQVERGIERYNDSEWVICSSDPEDGYTTAEEGKERKDKGKGEDAAKENKN